MALMYPPQVSAKTKSRGEIEMFTRLKSDPLTSEWIVLHSLDIADHRSQISGELDFVVIIPGQGVLCVEVKAAHSIKRANGMWYYGNDPIGDLRGPFKQAAEGMHSLRTGVMSRAPSLSNIVFWSAVVFPYCSFQEESPEWHQWQVVDRQKFVREAIGYSLKAVMMNARTFLARKPAARWFDPRSSAPTAEQCRLLAGLLRPDFEFFESPNSRDARRAEELKIYSEDQFAALDAMEENPRVIFHGPAGTGKTLLAIEAARRSNSSDKKTLLLCFNRLLGNWLRMQASTLGNITVGTLHSVMLSSSGVAAPTMPTREFWEARLPLLASDKILEKDLEPPFDQIIMDEAQDLLSAVYLDYLDLCLRGGLSSGRWIMFGDFERQMIYNHGQEVERLLESRFASAPRYSLRTNCRNTPRIAEMIRLLGGLDPPYSLVRRLDNEVEPRIYTYRDTGKQVNLLSSTLQGLLDEHCRPGEIVVLSTKADNECSASRLGGAWAERLTELRLSSVGNKIRYGTIHSFKGLESPIVILTDIDEVGSLEAKALFYVGISRALDTLVILASRASSEAMSRAILSRDGES